jgi:hypothetical protein
MQRMFAAAQGKQGAAAAKGEAQQLLGGSPGRTCHGLQVPSRAGGGGGARRAAPTGTQQQLARLVLATPRPCWAPAACL